MTYKQCLFDHDARGRRCRRSFREPEVSNQLSRTSDRWQLATVEREDDAAGVADRQRKLGAPGSRLAGAEQILLGRLIVQPECQPGVFLRIDREID